MVAQDEGDRPLPRLTVACRSLGLLAIEGLSVGLAGWSFRAWDRLGPYVASNTLPTAGRRYVLGNMGAAAALALLSALIVLRWKGSAGLDLIDRASRRCAPLVLSGLLPLLLQWQLWVGHELTFLVLTGLFGLGLQALMRIALSAAPVFASARAPALVALPAPMAQAASTWLPGALVATGAVFYTAYFSFYTIANHYNLGTASFDLGIENNLVWNAVHGGPLFKTSPLGGPLSTHLGYHQTYFSYVMGLVYLLAPVPQTLLVIQAAFLGAAAWPLYLLAKRRLGATAACAISLCYLLYPPLHGSNLYDFHYLPFAPFFLWLTLYLLEERRDRWAVIAVILTLSVREDMSALLIILGGYLVLTGKRPGAGLLVAAVGAAYFAVVKMTIMPHFLAGQSSYVHQYKDLLAEGDAGFGGVLKTVFGNPGFTMETLLTREKLIYLLQIVVPLAFLPWRFPVGLLCCLPGFFFTLLSTQYPPLIQISFQYTAYWTPFLFIAVVAILPRFKTVAADGPGTLASRHAWMAALVVSTLLTSNQYGAILQRNTARGGFGPYRFGSQPGDHDRHAQLYGLIGLVPPRAKIVAAETLVSHVSSRPDAYTLRIGLFDAEYLLTSISPRADELDNIVDALSHQHFGVVEQRGEFFLAKKGYPEIANGAVLASLGR